MPLFADDARQLVDELTDLALLLQSTNTAEQRKAVERILLGQDGKVLRPGWQSAWKTEQIVFTGWFIDIKQGERAWRSYYDHGPLNQNDDHRSWGLLYEVFRSLMQLHFSAKSEFLVRQYAGESLRVIAEFLGQVGVAFPTPGNPDQCITLAEAAILSMRRLSLV